MTPGVNLEALTPLEGGLENGDGESLVPADDFLPEGEGRVIGSQSTSHNYTPMHAEDVDDEEDICDSCGIVCGLDERNRAKLATAAAALALGILYFNSQRKE